MKNPSDPIGNVACSAVPQPLHTLRSHDNSLNIHTLSRLRSNGPRVARRKCRGVKRSRTFHPVPGCRQVIG